MNYRELQKALRQFKVEGLTDVKLNSSRKELEGEYTRLMAGEENIEESYALPISDFNSTLKKFANVLSLEINYVVQAVGQRQSLKLFLEGVLRRYKFIKRVDKNFDFKDLCFMATVKLGLRYEPHYYEVYSWAEVPEATVEQFLTYCSY